MWLCKEMYVPTTWVMRGTHTPTHTPSTSTNSYSSCWTPLALSGVWGDSKSNIENLRSSIWDQSSSFIQLPFSPSPYSNTQRGSSTLVHVLDTQYSWNHRERSVSHRLTTCYTTSPFDFLSRACSPTCLCCSAAEDDSLTCPSDLVGLWKH